MSFAEGPFSSPPVQGRASDPGGLGVFREGQGREDAGAGPPRDGGGGVGPAGD